MEYPIPKKSVEAWRAFQKTNSPHNLSLIFDRFVPNWGAGASKEEVRKAKDQAWKKITTATKKVDAALLAAWNTRWEKIIRHAHAEPLTLKTDWRLIAGLGRKGSLEVGFTFHRYGFPILPGSSVKGIARAWALISLATTLEAKSLNKLDELLNEEDEKKFSEAFRQAYPQASAQAITHASEFRQLFGTTGAAGHAIFFDAIPCQTPKLELDVMTPHYPDYYGDKSNKIPPADSQRPIPVYFLTVAPNVEFRFAVGWRGLLDDETRRLRALARDWLIRGLTELGAGAKTSAGYGYFLAPRR